MGRELTPEERREFEERRAKELPQIAKGLGMTPEKLTSLEETARAELKEAARRDSLTEEEFQELVERLVAQFETDMFRTEFRRTAEKRRQERTDGDILSLREEIMLDFEGMKKSEEYMK